MSLGQMDMDIDVDLSGSSCCIRTEAPRGNGTLGIATALADTAEAVAGLAERVARLEQMLDEEDEAAAAQLAKLRIPKPQDDDQELLEKS